MMPMEIDSARRLALRLHALHASDRSWILSRIEGEARSRLESMLQELDSLGFRIDQEILDSLEGHADKPESATDDYRQHVELLRGAQPEWLLKQLKGEPQAVIDCLITAHPWPWLAELQTSDALRASPIRREEPHPGPTPRVRQAVMAALAKQMKQNPAAFCQARGASGSLRETRKTRVSRTASGLWRWWPWKH